MTSGAPAGPGRPRATNDPNSETRRSVPPYECSRAQGKHGAAAGRRSSVSNCRLCGAPNSPMPAVNDDAEHAASATVANRSRQFRWAGHRFRGARPVGASQSRASACSSSRRKGGPPGVAHRGPRRDAHLWRGAGRLRSPARHLLSSWRATLAGPAGCGVSLLEWLTGLLSGVTLGERPDGVDATCLMRFGSAVGLSGSAVGTTRSESSRGSGCQTWRVMSGVTARGCRRPGSALERGRR